MDRLVEADLFTDARGSMYLYRLQLEKETKTNTPITSLPSIPSIPSTSTHLPLPTVTDEGSKGGGDDDLPLYNDSEKGALTENEGETTAEVEAMKTKFTLLEGGMREMEKNIETLITVVKGLAVKLPNDSSNSSLEGVEQPAVVARAHHCVKLELASLNDSLGLSRATFQFKSTQKNYLPRLRI